MGKFMLKAFVLYAGAIVVACVITGLGIHWLSGEGFPWVHILLSGGMAVLGGALYTFVLFGALKNAQDKKQVDLFADEDHEEYRTPRKIGDDRFESTD